MSEGLYSKPFYGRNLSLNMEKLSCVTLGNLSVSNINRQGQQTLTANVTDSDKHSSLLRSRINYTRKVL
jgi:hypothetical protein